jgi:hypothetical protein
MYHVLMNTGSNAAGGTDLDTAAITDDPSFTIRGSPNHWIFTEPYVIVAAWTFGASLTKMRLSSPTLDAFGQPNLMPVNRSLNPQTPLNEIDLRQFCFPLPIDEEIKILLSNNLGAASEQETTAIAITPPNWSDAFPGKGTCPTGANLLDPRQPGFNLLARTSQSVTLIANDWSTEVNLTFDQLPRGGWYGVIGGDCVGTNAQMWRLNFPRFQLINGRKFFPAGPAKAAAGDVHPLQIDRHLGILGVFHTFEPPKLAIFGSAAGAQTITMWLHIVYLGPGSEKGPTPAGWPGT